MIGPLSARAVGLVALAVLAVGCGGIDRPPGEAEPTGATSSPPSGLLLDHPGLKNPVGAIEDLSDLTCKRGKDGWWHATGQLRNPGNAKTDYLVAVSVVRTETSEVLSRQQRAFTLEPGQRVPVDFVGLQGGKKDADRTQCVPRVLKEGA